MPPKKTQKITFEQLGDLLQNAWEEGHIGEDVHESIESGVIPIRYLREKLRLVIEKSDEEGYLDVTQLADVIPFPVYLPTDDDQLDQYREAA